MTQRYATAADVVEFEPAQSCGAFRTKVRNNFFSASVMLIAQRFFGGKEAEKIPGLAGCKKRTAEYWKADAREMDMGDFFRLVDKGDVHLGAKVLDEFWERLPATTREFWLRQLMLKQESERAEREERETLARIQQRKSNLQAQLSMPLPGRARR